jgi:para-nitrobenzyl esterase
MIAGIRRWTALFALVVITLFATQAFAVAQGQRYQDEVFTSVDITSDIAYGEALDEEGDPVTLYLDLYQPSGDTELSRPALVWVHGGSFTMGDKADELETTIGDLFAKRGYVVVSINYRLRPGHFFTWEDPEFYEAINDAQHDAQAAVRWLRANAETYHINPNRIAAAGYSAGAITSLYVGYNSGDPGDSGNPGYPSDVRCIVDVSGAVDTTLMDAGEPPVLVVHGNADVIVPYSYAVELVAQAEAVGIPVEFHTLDGVSHFLWQDPYSEQIIGWMSDFLYSYLAPQLAVGGIAEPPENAPTGDGLPVPNAGTVAGVAGATALLLVGGGWYARRYSVRRR